MAPYCSPRHTLGGPGSSGRQSASGWSATRSRSLDATRIGTPSLCTPSSGSAPHQCQQERWIILRSPLSPPDRSVHVLYTGDAHDRVYGGILELQRHCEFGWRSWVFRPSNRGAPGARAPTVVLHIPHDLPPEAAEAARQHLAHLAGRHLGHLDAGGLAPRGRRASGCPRTRCPNSPVRGRKPACSPQARRGLARQHSGLVPLSAGLGGRLARGTGRTGPRRASTWAWAPMGGRRACPPPTMATSYNGFWGREPLT